jgi:hypothetical protein
MLKSSDILYNVLCQHHAPWYGPNGSLNHAAYDVAFTVWNRLLAIENREPRAVAFLCNAPASVSCLMREMDSKGF